MSVVLPVTLANMKDKYEVFFVDVYVITLATGVLHYTNLDVPVEWYVPGTSTPMTYEPIPIQRGSLKQTLDNKIDNLTLTISDASNAFMNALLQSFDFRGSQVDIYQIAYPDSLSNKDAYKYVFSGYIDAPSLDMDKATFSTTLTQRMVNTEAGRIVGVNCNAWFGDSDECGATKGIKTSTVKSSSTQYVIYDNSITETAGYWKNGTITISYETKKILSSAVGSVTVEFPFYSTPTVGTSYTMSTGCDHTYTDCTRHNNTSNFGGFPAVALDYMIKT
jgi:Phage conserved hypothetical protein BR0599./Uncharacterized conserved protein (DUF2163).